MDQTFQNLKEISLDGFQVVSRDMLMNNTARYSTPLITIWYDSISFNKASILALDCCERVLIQVHPVMRSILISSVNAFDKDGVVWHNKNHKDTAKKITCPGFTTKIYDLWEWDKASAYRCPGKAVTSNGKIMLMFDMSEPEVWVYRNKPKEG